MRLPIPITPAIEVRNTVSKVMLRVLLALIPGTVAMTWFFGWGTLINIVIAVITAELAEALILALRQKPIKPALSDLSAALTAVLLALSIPPLAPWWIAVIGALFAIIIAKQLYGGIGYNPFNPAMVAYVVLLISFPQQMTFWLSPDSLSNFKLNFNDTLRIICLEQTLANISLDAMTMATPLDTVKTAFDQGNTLAQIQTQTVFGWFGGSDWEWISVCYLLSGFWLIIQGTISWQIPVGFLVGLAAISLICFILDPTSSLPPTFHLFSGATMLGAFFIATDPVTAATTSAGRLIYGVSIGLLVFVIRTWGGYPDGVAFAVLLMNLAVPTIDNYTSQHVFGHRE